MRDYLASWGRPLASRVVPLTYDDVFAAPLLRAATYVFADLERLAPAAAARAARLHDALAARGFRMLNHPTRSLRRYHLLRALAARGTNRFAVYRVGEAVACFPVFVRVENDHEGSRTALLPDRAALTAAITALERAGVARDRLLVTEFCDTADARGIYRKYSAFVIGDRIVPRHVFYSRCWMVKLPDLVDDDLLAEERAYVESNPHQDQLRAIFGLAGLEWGRIDYGLLDGALQVWEINTNPQIMSFADGGGPARLPQHARAAVALRSAFEAIDHRGAPRRVRLPGAVRAVEPGTQPDAADPGSAAARLARAILRRTGLVWHEERLRHWAGLLGVGHARPRPAAAAVMGVGSARSGVGGAI